MNRWTAIAIALLTSTALVSIPSLSTGGQFGGLIKRGIPDSVKKVTEGKPDEEKKPAEPTTAPAPASAPTAATPPSGEPGVIPITEEVLIGLQKGLQTEADLQDKLTAEVAAREKARTDYKTCSGQVPASPEAQEIALRMLNLPNNPTSEEMQRLYERNDRDIKALILKACGTEPDQINIPRRLTAIQVEGAKATGITPEGAK